MIVDSSVFVLERNVYSYVYLRKRFSQIISKLKQTFVRNTKSNCKSQLDNNMYDSSNGVNANVDLSKNL